MQVSRTQANGLSWLWPVRLRILEFPRRVHTQVVISVDPSMTIDGTKHKSFLCMLDHCKWFAFMQTSFSKLQLNWHSELNAMDTTAKDQKPIRIGWKVFVVMWWKMLHIVGQNLLAWNWKLKEKHFSWILSKMNFVSALKVPGDWWTFECLPSWKCRLGMDVLTLAFGHSF